MNEVLNAIITRRSCKSFKPDMISQQDIDQVSGFIRRKRIKHAVSHYHCSDG